ncbi:hypothetical protein TWF718_007274 [Orbilia javanica]|uniref:F-box domain-containing protein n=1 Tax=Orbilia javanica TaxID=47235 RepID=A0AAN8RD55_9PEZI
MIRLLELPIEILYLVLDELPRQARYRMGLTCKYIGSIAVPGLYSLCYFEFCLQQRTYVLSGPVGDVEANYTAYEKYHTAVRHICINHRTCFRDRNLEIRAAHRMLENSHLDTTQAPPDLLPHEPASIFSQFGLLIPQFAALKKVDLRNHEYTSDAALRQIQTIRKILVSCPSLKDFSIQINCDSQVRLSELRELEIGYQYDQPGQAYPRLTDLTIQITETCYDNNLEPAQNLLDTLCRLLNPSARTVKRLEFDFEVNRLADDWNYNPWYWPPREDQDWSKLDLPLVEAVCLSVRQDGLSSLMISEYIHFDPAKVRKLRLNSAEKILDIADELSIHFEIPKC